MCFSQGNAEVCGRRLRHSLSGITAAAVTLDFTLPQRPLITAIHQSHDAPVREEFTRPERHGQHQTTDVRHLNIAGLYVLCMIIAIQEPNNFGVNLKIPQNSHLTHCRFLSSHNEAQWRIDRRVCFY